MAALGEAAKEAGDMRTRTEGLPVSFPEFTFDPAVCSLKRSVSDGGRVLSNRLQSGTPSQSDSKRCQFSGTCVSRPLPAESCFWQLRCVLTPRPRIRQWYLCSMGAVEREALFVDSGQWFLWSTSLSFDVWLETSNGHVTAEIYRGKTRLAIETLTPFSPDRPVEVTLGFLLDAGKRHLYVIEVSKPRVLGSCQMELSSPLFPAVAMKDEETVGCEVRVELQTGEMLTLTRDLAQLLTSLLERDRT